jgi:alpha-tubulin suppressor-like RCC1 family protein
MKSAILLLFVLFSINIYPQCWSKIANGFAHTLAIDTDGNLWAWGYNNHGQLGNNSITSSNTPIIISDAGGWTDIAAGHMFSMGIKEGYIYTWGDNSYGQLGNGNTNDLHIPTKMGISNQWTQVFAGNMHALALKQVDLYVWGRNTSGELGLGISDQYVASPKHIEHNYWRTVAAGNGYTIGIKSDGSLWATGTNQKGQLGLGDENNRNVFTRIGISTDWTQIATGAEHVLALTNQNCLYTWGYNFYGQLGNGNNTNYNTPQYIVGNTWNKISAGANHSGGINTSGLIFTWGRNLNGQLGKGNTDDKNTPTIVGSNANWSDINLGKGNYTIAIKPTKEYWAAGYNANGQLGNGNNSTLLNLTHIQNCLVSTIRNEELNTCIYPNPFCDLVHLHADINQLSKITILDNTGRIIDKLTPSTTTLNLSHLNKGMYLLLIESESGIKSEIIFKK